MRRHLKCPKAIPIETSTDGALERAKKEDGSGIYAYEIGRPAWFCKPAPTPEPIFPLTLPPGGDCEERKSTPLKSALFDASCCETIGLTSLVRDDRNIF